MEEKIKDLYKCDSLDGNDPLVIWHNRVIEKNVDELTVEDVARCIRQNIFMDSAVEMMLVYLLHNPYEGDAFGGELMEKAGEIDLKYIEKYKGTISEIIEKAYRFIKTNEWESKEDKLEYKEAVDKLHERVK